MLPVATGGREGTMVEQGTPQAHIPSAQLFRRLSLGEGIKLCLTFLISKVC